MRKYPEMWGFRNSRGVASTSLLSATPDNAPGTQEFPHCGKGTDRGRIRFRPKVKELAMAERRKTANSPKPATRKTTRKTARKTSVRKATPKRWSQQVTRESDALDLKQGVFKLPSAKKIAASLKRSAERSSRRKAGAYRSALSMLTFYINRAGKNLPRTERDRLERAKGELKRQFGKD
jgi:Protein of unknown function (DUF3175)